MSAVGRRIINLHDLRGELVQAQDAIEELTETYGGTSDAAADAEADFKFRYARAIVELADSGVKQPVAEREARAHVAAGDAFRVWQLAKARHDTVRQGLLSARTRQETLRTLASSERALLS